MNGSQHLLLFVFAVVVIAACNKKNESPAEPTTQLTIQVTDLHSFNGIEIGGPIESAVVTLYASLEDWQQETNALSSSYTDAKGEITFSFLSPIEYFFDVRKGDLTNWEHTFRSGVLVENAINNAMTNIYGVQSNGKNGHYLLSAAAGKDWVVHSVKDPDVEHIDSADFVHFKDWQFTFFKDQSYRLNNAGDNTEVGSWELSPTALKVESQGGQIRLDVVNIQQFADTSFSAIDTAYSDSSTSMTYFFRAVD